MHSRLLLTTLGAAALLFVAGCGGSDTIASGDELGKQPQISIPSPLPTKLTITNTITGKGDKLAANHLVRAHLVAKVARGGKDIFNSYKNGQAVIFPLGQGQLLPGWETALTEKTVGSRVVVITPPADAFGESGNPELGVEKTDTIIAVFDILESFNGKSSADGTPVTPASGLPTAKADKGKAPVVTIPKDYTPGTKLVVQPLLEGDGETLEAGDTLIAQYVGVNARDGKVFDSSWQRGSPANFQIGNGQVIPGWDEGLVGKKLGSRILLVIPPAKGYGKAGNEGAGIKGTDTLVFVVDLLARQPPAPDATDTTTAQP